MSTANNAQNNKGITNKVNGEKKKRFSAEEIKEVMQTPEAQAIMKEMVAQIVAKQSSQPVYIRQNDEMVTLLYMGAVAEGSTINLGEKLGEIQGRGGTRKYPKALFLENMNPAVLRRLKDRRLIVIDGFDDEERARFGLNYSDGELVGQDIYYKLLDMDENTVISIFKAACYRHKQLIASLYIDAYNAGDNRINQPLIQKLNKASKAADPSGMFTAILKDMAKDMAEGLNEDVDNE